MGCNFDFFIQVFLHGAWKWYRVSDDTIVDDSDLPVLDTIKTCNISQYGTVASFKDAEKSDLVFFYKDVPSLLFGMRCAKEEYPDLFCVAFCPDPASLSEEKTQSAVEEYFVRFPQRKVIFSLEDYECAFEQHNETVAERFWDKVKSFDANPDPYISGYLLFTKIANVRNDSGLLNVHTPRGHPIDMSPKVLEFLETGNEYHSQTWLTMEEVLTLDLKEVPINITCKLVDVDNYNGVPRPPSYLDSIGLSNSRDHTKGPDLFSAGRFFYEEEWLALSNADRVDIAARCRDQYTNRSRVVICVTTVTPIGTKPRFWDHHAEFLSYDPLDATKRFIKVAEQIREKVGTHPIRFLFRFTD